MLHVGGLKGKVLLGANVVDGGHEHKGPQVLHAAALVEEHLQPIGESLRRVGCCRFAAAGRLFRRCRCSTLNLCDKAINFLQQRVDIICESFPVLDVLDLLPEEVDGLEKQIKQLRPEALRHDGNGLLPEDCEEVLGPVGDGHEGIEFHHGRRTLDGVHDTENRVDVIVGKRVSLLRGQHNAVQLL